MADITAMVPMPMTRIHRPRAKRVILKALSLIFDTLFMNQRVKSWMLFALGCMIMCLSLLCLAFAVQKEPLRLNIANSLAINADASSLPSRQEAYRVLEPFAFMVWPEHKAQLIEQAEQTLHRQINLRPYDPEMWRALLFLQSQQQLSSSERYWTLENAMAFADWNNKALYWLAKACVNHHQQFESIDLSSCKKVYEKLPSNFSLARLAVAIGVDKNHLEKTLRLSGVRQ